MKVLAISLGDINGIGPEVALKAVYKRKWPTDLGFVLVGNPAIIKEQANTFGLPCPPDWTPEQGRLRRKVVIWDPTPETRVNWTPGIIRITPARLAVDWIHAAVRGCLARQFHGIVTAPICKEGLQKAGIDIPGHTELLARLTRTRRFAMMLLGGGLRVVLVTRHIPLARVPEALTPERIREATLLTAEALPWLGVPKGRIAVAGLNPHAGDGGVIGDEEKTMIAPVVRRLQRGKLLVDGPIPPDVVFHEAIEGKYAAVICMYHDQGLGPLKMLAFDKGVNVTLGLPFVRTSPDHGTAFNIAGKGIADPSSMVEAIRLAHQVSKRKNPWRKK